MKRAMVIVVVTLGVCAGLLYLFIGVPAATPKASYKGRSAEAWLGEMWTNEPAMFDAFQYMGTNAYPTLIEALRKKDSPLDEFYQRFHAKLPLSLRRHLTRPIPAGESYIAAELVIQNSPYRYRILPALLRAAANESGESFDHIVLAVAEVAGPQDTNAVPVLMDGLKSTNFPTWIRITEALGKIGPGAKAAVPALSAWLTDTNIDTRFWAAQAFWQVTGDTNKVIPVMRGIMNDKSVSVMGAQKGAVIDLSLMNPKDISLIPVFIDWLSSPNQNDRVSAACALGAYRGKAREAIPALTRMANSASDGRSRDMAAMALREIDPEAAERLK